MLATLLIVASSYALPDGVQPPAPNAPRSARIDAALKLIRAADDKVDFAVRDLALVGESALPAIVARLNQAPAGERLLLLAAVKRMPAAAALLAQAKQDANPAIRAWAMPPPERDPVNLRLLAARYLNLLALAEEKRRLDADVDLQGLPGRLERPVGYYKPMRERMRDRFLANEVQAKRGEIADRFARAGAVALRAGTLRPSLKNPVFVAYLALLREESGAATFYAIPGLTAVGPALAPVLEPLLDRENHDPRTILRILFAVREDAGRGLLARFATMRPAAQRALIALAGNEVALLESAALAKDGSVRAAALDALLRLDAPAGATPARKLLDPDVYGPNEYRRAAILLARAGNVEPVAVYATLAVPDDGSVGAAQLRKLRQVCAAALRSEGGEPAAAIGERLLQSESDLVRLLGVDLIRDPARLLELARASAQTDARFSVILARRALVVGRTDASVAREVVAVLGATGKPLPFAVHQMLGRRGHVDLLIELAADEKDRRYAVRQLAKFDRIDPRHEAALLELHRKQPDDVTLSTILPLGSVAVQARFDRADPEQALDALVERAELDYTTPIRIALIERVRNARPKASADLLVRIRKAASVMKSVEPGLFHALLEAWERVPAELEQNDPFGGPPQEKISVLKSLVRSDDVRSAELLFADLLDGKFKGRQPFVYGTLHAAAKLLGRDRLSALVPVLNKEVPNEYPDKSGRPADHDGYRWALLQSGIMALGYRNVEPGLAFLCDLLIDPGLQYNLEWKDQSLVPYWALKALRNYPAVKVNAALRRVLARAEAKGRLARLRPTHLYRLIGHARQGRSEGRGLYEVGLALCEVLARLPWEGPIHYERMRALGGLRRHKGAAQAARAAAAAKRIRSYDRIDGFRTPEYFDGRAKMYDAWAAGDFSGVVPTLADDPFLLNLVAWYTQFYVPDKDIAVQSAERAVRRSAGLYHAYRDTLAAVRLAQKRPREALELLDVERILPYDRPVAGRWHLYFRAQAELMLGDAKGARQDLERALNQDRRLVPYARKDPAFAVFADLFPTVEEDFLESLFSGE